jgi:predicted heme/steroid binding protein
MDELVKRSLIKQYLKEICHYSQMQVFATSVYQKKYLEYQIDEVADELTDLILTVPNVNSNTLSASQQPQPPEPPSERVISKEELAQNDGSGTNFAYVAVNGVVYDVTNVMRWGGGTHFGLYAGNDLTSAFRGCHIGMFEILQQLPIVGMLKQD